MGGFRAGGRRLRGGDVHDHHVPELLGGRERLDVLADAGDRLPRRLHGCHARRVGETLDHVAGGHDRAGPQPALHLGEEAGRPVEQLRRDRPALPPHASGLVAEPAGANVVTAHDEIAEVHEIEPREGLERGHEADRLDGPALECREPRHHRRRHAPLRADEPQTDASASHGGGFRGWGGLEPLNS